MTYGYVSSHVTPFGLTRLMYSNVRKGMPPSQPCDDEIISFANLLRMWSSGAEQLSTCSTLSGDCSTRMSE